MPILFSNPLGFLALLGIPVILLIHFLQRQSQTLPISTLFLLERIDRQSREGSKIDQFRNSLPLWLQILAILLLTWLLVGPRWASETSIQRIAVVLDSSASMEAFQKEAGDELAERLPRLAVPGTETAFTALESHPDGKTLYRGASLTDLLRSLDSWDTSTSAHSPEEALRLARSVAGSGGIVLFVTDHAQESLPYAAHQLSIGEKIENVGFAGFQIEENEDETIWRATVRNYSDTAQTRDWFLASAGGRTATREISLAPDETRTLTGKFPTESERVQLALSPDRFTRDDTLFLVSPKPKTISVGKTGATNLDKLVRSLVESLANAPLADAGELADLIFTSYNPIQPSEAPPVSVVFLNQKSVPKEFFTGPIIAANHPLVTDLNWQGLIARKTPSIPILDTDVPLLWQGDRVLIALRESSKTSQLLFNFDVEHANAERLPAFVITIHRFVSEVRERRIGLEQINTELRQPLSPAFEIGDGAEDLTIASGEKKTILPLDKVRFLRAPDAPGFFEVSQGATPLIRAACNFADTREADFSEAEFAYDLAEMPAESLVRQTRADPIWQLWVLAGIALLLASWFAISRDESGQEMRTPS